MWIFLVAGCSRPPPVPAPVRAPQSDALYFVMVDRFADARPDPPGTTDPSDPQAWHGGDLAGVLAHLDHLQSLGVGGLWLSPLSAARTEPIDAWGAYHGYWVDDLTAVEPRLGTVDDVRALADAVHQRGMSLYLDMVFNHVGSGTTLTEQHPDWFHGRGDIEDWDDPVQRVTHDVHGLPDLAQENPEVFDHLLAASLVWLDIAKPDGFRVDAVGHLPVGFLDRLGSELKARAGPEFELLGEVFDGDPARLAARAKADRLDAVFDFPFHYALTDFFCRDAPAGRLASALLWSNYGGARPVTLVDNHDTPRILATCGGDVDRASGALALLLVSRGQPSITWGTEIGLAGGPEPDNRADMNWDAPQHPLGDVLQRGLARRAGSEALRRGDTRVLSLSESRATVVRSTGEAAVRIEIERGQPVRVDEVEPSPPPAGDVTVIVRVEGGPAGLTLVGSQDAIGGWNAARGVRATDNSFTLTVPDGTVLEFKLGATADDGGFTFEDRVVNRFLLVRRTAEDCGDACVGPAGTTLLWGAPD